MVAGDAGVPCTILVDGAASASPLLSVLVVFVADLLQLLWEMF
jgi:hypothetical protein